MCQRFRKGLSLCLRCRKNRSLEGMRAYITYYSMLALSSELYVQFPSASDFPGSLTTWVIMTTGILCGWDRDCAMEVDFIELKVCSHTGMVQGVFYSVLLGFPFWYNFVHWCGFVLGSAERTVELHAETATMMVCVLCLYWQDLIWYSLSGSSILLFNFIMSSECPWPR